MDIKSQRNRYVAFAFAASDVLFECDAQGRIGFAAGASDRLFGVPLPAIEHRQLCTFFAPAEHGVLSRAFSSLVSGQRFGPLLLRAAQAQGPLIAISGCRMPQSPDIIHLALSLAPAVGSDWRETVMRDDETGLADTQSFNVAVTHTLRQARSAGQDLQLSLINIPDLDGFRARTGKAGLQVFLSEMGARLREMALNDAAARVADDRFTILHDRGADTATLADEITRLSRAHDPEGTGVTLACGIIEIAADLNDGDAAQALIHTISSFARATIAANAVSDLGDALAHRMQESMTRLGVLKREILGSRMRLVVQPIVELDTGKVRHHELLSRFGTGRTPHDEVTFAESVGLIYELDETVIGRAIAYLENPVPGGPRALAINLSGRSLLHTPLMDQLVVQLKARRALSPYLLFEITESHTITDLAAANRQIGRLRALGFAVGLDDFGAGAASYQYLRVLDIDFIKIDGAYIRDVLTSPRDQAMLRSIAGLTRELAVGLVAEHIEKPEQARLLAGLGVRLGQGLLFGHALPLPAPRPA